MVVVVHVPAADRCKAFVLAVQGVGVEQLVGQDPLVALDLPVVSWRARPGPLVTRGEGAHCSGEVLGAGAGPVVGHDPGEPGGPVGTEQARARSKNPIAVLAVSVDRARSKPSLCERPRVNTGQQGAGLRSRTN